jgi:hypothetical protein
MRIMIFFITAGFIWSCTSRSKPGEEPIAVKTYDTSTLYYDIPLAINNEIAEIKRTFAFTWRINIENGKRDSAAVDTTQLLELAAPFLEYNLNERRYRKYYKEDLFEDGDTRSIVLTYSTNHPDFPLRTASVLLDNESQELKRIDIMKSRAFEGQYSGRKARVDCRQGFPGNKDHNCRRKRIHQSDTGSLEKQISVF